MDRILARQIRKHLGDFSDENKKKMQPFFDAVLDMYESFEDDRKLMDHCLDTSSKELMENNEKLVHQSYETQKVIDNMLQSVKNLDHGKSIDVQSMELSDLSQYLKDLIKSDQKNKLELIKQKNSLFTIIDSIGEGLMVVNHDRKIIMFNKMAEQLSGLRLSDIMNTDYRDAFFFYDEKTKKQHKDFIQVSMSDHTMGFYTKDIVLKSTSGRYKDISVITSPMGKLSQEEMGCVVVFRDTSKERELDRMKDEFVSIASHELRTPMTVINGYAGLLLSEKKGVLGEKQKVYMEKIKCNTVQLINLVNDMLSLSRAESGKIEIRREKYDLGEQIHELGESFKELFKTKGLSLHHCYEPCIIYSDPLKVGEILTNLIGNASKFTKKGGKVEIWHTQEKDTVTVYVRDTGEGISDENIDKLFQKFSQVNSHLHKKAEGTGLGLAICKMYTEILEGEITVDSTVGEGSTFSFTLPISEKKH